MTIHEMQNLNRATIEHASKVIVPGMTLIELRKLCFVNYVRNICSPTVRIPFGIGM